MLACLPQFLVIGLDNDIIMLALVVYGGYAPVGRIRVPFTHRDCCVKKEI